MKRYLLIALAGSLAILAVPGIAEAQPPNDDFNDAIVVTEPLPFSHSTSTVDATRAPDDPVCSGNGPTVWYRYTPSTDLRVEADTAFSDYDTTLSVYTGSRSALTQIACNDNISATLQSRVAFQADAGTTYYFMVGGAGNLSFSVQVAPPPLEVTVMVDPRGTFNPHTGEATISGTITCSPGTDFARFFGELQQRRGGNFVTGSFEVDLGFSCARETPWMATVQGADRFRGGPATVNLTVLACDFFECIEPQTSHDVRLRGSQLQE